MSFCPECGKENSEGQKFCTGCGKPLQQPLTGPDPNGILSHPPIQSQQSSAYQSLPGTEPKPKSSKNVLIIIGIIIVIAIIAAGVFVGLPALKKMQESSGGSLSESTPSSQYSPASTFTPVESVATPPPETFGQPATPVPEISRSAIKKYTSDQFGFSIDYPSDWELNEKNYLEVPSLSRYDVVEFYSPSIERCDTDKSSCIPIRATVMIEVETAPGTNELADYFVPQTAKILSEHGAEITKRDAMYKLSGAKAYRLDYENMVDKYDQSLISAYTLIHNNAYILTYRAYAPIKNEKDLFKEYYNAADSMFNSFSVNL